MAELSRYAVSVQKRVMAQNVLFVVHCPSVDGSAGTVTSFQNAA